MEPLDWAFVPGTTSIVAQTADNSLYLIDPLNGTPTQPLGGHSRMYGFVPGSTTLIVDSNGDYKGIDLATGNTSALPTIALPEATDLQQLLPHGGDRGYVAWLATQEGASSVVVINNGNARQIYAEDPDPAGGIQNICPFPQRSISRGRKASPRYRHQPRQLRIRKQNRARRHRNRTD